jgi:hypothetical protein
MYPLYHWSYLRYYQKKVSRKLWITLFVQCNISKKNIYAIFSHYFISVTQTNISYRLIRPINFCRNDVDPFKTHIKLFRSLGFETLSVQLAVSLSVLGFVPSD